MFALALLIGIYSYLIFILGLIGLLNKEMIFLSSLIFIFLAIYYFYKHKEDLPKINFKNKKIKPYLILFLVLAIVNFIGALSPEYSFDALWYHLTLPRVFLQEETIISVSEGIFYYSVMPKLGEMLFTPFVAFNLEVLAKLTQWLFGILTSVVIYKISRRYFDEKKSFFAVLIFYSSLVVAWESTVAYVDLIRAFFEVMALWGFLVWRDTKDRKILLESGIFLGLAISTKLFALGSIPIFVILFFFSEKDRISAFKSSIIFSLTAMLSASPWFLMSYIATKNPIFPIFSKNFSEGSYISIFYPQNLFNDLFTLFVRADDPISPLYIIFLPLLIIYFRKLNKELKLISIYFLLALFIWYFIPRLGGGRFMVPYLPAASIVCIALIESIKSKSLKKYSYILIIFVFLITVIYRGVANARYIPVILGIESKDAFLTNKLNFNFGDFYDTDGFFKNNIKKDDKVLLFGFHNLYYADFPFVHESYVRPGDKFNYIAVQGTQIPERFRNWRLIYTNDKTGVRVYSLDGVVWHY